MQTLNLQEIKRDGQDRIEFADAMEKLQGVVDRLYPGHKVAVISQDEIAKESSANSSEGEEADFRSLMGVQQMEVILREKPMTANDLFDEMQRRGAIIPKATVQSTLSRKKSVFHNGKHGIWSVISRANRSDLAAGELISNNMNGAR